MTSQSALHLHAYKYTIRNGREQTEVNRKLYNGASGSRYFSSYPFNDLHMQLGVDYIKYLSNLNYPY